MKPSVLMLTSLYDFSADLVALNLKQKGVPFLRINKEQVQDFRFSFSLTTQILKIEKHSGQYHGAWSIDDSLKSVWFRQPVFLRNTTHSPLTIEEQLTKSQWSAFFRAFSMFDNAAWMNWPQATYLAESKPYQLLAAHRCGFKIPETIVGNTASNKIEEQVIIKSLDTVLLREGNDCLFTYSTCPGKLSDEEVKSAPFITQEYISNKTDVRVTVIGESLSSVQILSDRNPIAGDWRLMPKEKLEYKDINLPKPISSACKVLTRNLSLEFAAIDLIERENDYFFLEVNPTGEWGWLNCAERRFDKIISDWLAKPPKIPRHVLRRVVNA